MDKPNDDAPDKPEKDEPGKSNLFPDTQSKLISDLRSSDSRQSRLALDKIAGIYEEAIRLTAMRLCFDREQAMNRAQSFWEMMFKKGHLSKFRGEGRFRGFLRECLRLHILSEVRREGREPEMVSIDNPDWDVDLIEAASADADDRVNQLEPEEVEVYNKAARRAAVQDVKEAWTEKGHGVVFQALLKYRMEGKHGDLKATAESIQMSYDNLKQLHRKLKADLKAALAVWL